MRDHHRRRHSRSDKAMRSRTSPPMGQSRGSRERGHASGPIAESDLSQRKTLDSVVWYGLHINNSGLHRPGAELEKPWIP